MSDDDPVRGRTVDLQDGYTAHNKTDLAVAQGALCKVCLGWTGYRVGEEPGHPVTCHNCWQEMAGEKEDE